MGDQGCSWVVCVCVGVYEGMWVIEGVHGLTGLCACMRVSVLCVCVVCVCTYAC